MFAVLSVALLMNQGPEFVVQPYYVYPSDQPFHQEYLDATARITKEVQQWYDEQVGSTFHLAPIKVVRSPQSYKEMLGVSRPAGKDRDVLLHMPNWWNALERAVGGWKPRQVAWVFAQGGGGKAEANLVGDWQGMGIFGDWVLEPISGVREPSAIHAGFATWEVQGNTPMGTTVHELGHAFGLHHPDRYLGTSVMRAHWDYPQAGLMAHEKMILRNSPFFNSQVPTKNVPHLNFENADVMKWGELVELSGRGFEEIDRVEFKDNSRVFFVQPLEVTSTEIRVKVPTGLNGGFIRIRQGGRYSNIVPVNFYPKTN